MTEYRLEDVFAEVATGQANWSLVDARSPNMDDLPQPWCAIAASTDPGDRCHRALSLWNSEFMELLPGFTTHFVHRLTDVRVFRRQLGVTSENVLIYIAGQAGDGLPALWLGWDPAIQTQPMPKFFDFFPGPVKIFLQEVHAGFTAQDWESYGILRPDSWESFAGYDWFSDESFEEVGASPSEVMWFTRDSGQLYYCINSRLPVGKISLAYEGNFDPPSEFADEVDELLARRWDAQ